MMLHCVLLVQTSGEMMMEMPTMRSKDLKAGHTLMQQAKISSPGVVMSLMSTAAQGLPLITMPLHGQM